MANLTLAHVLMAVAALEALGALFYGLTWLRHRAELRGTPLYARGRDARRLTIWLAIFALLFLALACLTPLGDIPLGSRGPV